MINAKAMTAMPTTNPTFRLVDNFFQNDCLGGAVKIRGQVMK